MRTANKLMRSHGVRQFEKMKRKKVISTDPRYTEPVARVAERLKQVIILPNAEWEFVVFEDLSPNAFALPGGKVGVNTGLFQIIGDDHQADAILAAILGHEISHITAAHAQQRILHALALVAAAQFDIGEARAALGDCRQPRICHVDVAQVNVGEARAALGQCRQSRIHQVVTVAQVDAGEARAALGQR